MKRILTVLVLLLAQGCVAQVPQNAYVSVAESAREGGVSISAIDGEPVSQEEGFELPAGSHEISVRCRLQNGIDANFNFSVDLQPEYSYCFFTQDGPNACKILYAEIAWDSGGRATCR
jgi:hypothetical protein